MDLGSRQLRSETRGLWSSMRTVHGLVPSHIGLIFKSMVIIDNRSFHRLLSGR